MVSHGQSRQWLRQYGVDVRLTISSTLLLFRMNGALMHREICRKHSIFDRLGVSSSSLGGTRDIHGFMKTANSIGTQQEFPDGGIVVSETTRQKTMASAK